MKDCIFSQSSTELFLSAGIGDDGNPSGFNWELVRIYSLEAPSRS
jgi:hypothetical protein